ncbi:putative phosphosugar isomerase [Marinitoga piezophila KA3]|uniref:Putative phosphosugar isomerase n=1 Tax=Marinitoga piezophila (strain DSM 14283 / JCM 11233 / KA3) TaxID=443254 RepID=H2J7T8_MARPK|nr:MULTISPECIES: SIS domain-containing protein [Marinitoga]AEX85429.1 putative phosphosugar isomerase [Marinitoga piezophila KA3]NUU97568.1 sugar isomerase [Marinitoga sp. 1138]
MKGEKTLREIERIPELLKHTKEFDFSFEKDKKYTFVGCGSSYNLGYITTEMLRKNGYNAEIISGGNVIVFDKVPESDVAIFLSRTGESTETVKAVEHFKKRKIKTIGITCEKNSTLTKVCDESFVFDFANEESVVMTGSFVFILNFLLNGIEKHELSNESIEVVKNVESIIDKIDLKKFSHFVFLGFEEQYGISKEGALKIQEMAIQNVEFHEPLEYRHGPKSLVTDKTLVIINSKDTKEERILAEELRVMEAEVIFVGENGDLKIPYKNGFESPLKMILPQYLGYKKALTEGHNPDKPRNLSKSVILE